MWADKVEMQEFLAQRVFARENTGHKERAYGFVARLVIGRVVGRYGHGTLLMPGSTGPIAAAVVVRRFVLYA